jgi:ribonuclease HI
MPIVALYGDGGVVERNPSPVGGVWAWCGVDERGHRVVEDSGIVLADPGGVVTNNQMEWVAIMQALEAQPDGWSGDVVTDSRNTLIWLGQLRDNLNDPYFLIPRPIDLKWWQRMSISVQRHGELTFKHVKGHPTAVDLARGYTVDDNGARKHDVSSHQVWCDMECTRQAVRARLTNGGSKRMEAMRQQIRRDVARRVVV